MSYLTHLPPPFRLACARVLYGPERCMDQVRHSAQIEDLGGEWKGERECPVVEIGWCIEGGALIF